jgi:hypothetical protein
VCTVRGVSHAENVELPDATHCMMQSNPKGAAELLATSSRAIPCARDRRQRRRHPGLQGDPLTVLVMQRRRPRQSHLGKADRSDRRTRV